MKEQALVFHSFLLGLSVKKVVFYLSDFQSGGTEWFALRLARELARQGVKPLFLVAQRKGELIGIIQKEFDTTILSGHSYGPRLFLLLPEMLRFVRDNNPDWIISGLPLLNVIAAIAIRFSHTSCRLIAVEHMRLHVHLSSPDYIKQKVKQWMTQWVHARADHVVCVSRTVLSDIQEHIRPSSGHRPQLIYNPIIPDDLDSLTNEPILHRWVRERESPLLVSIGRLLPVKDFPTLLKAFRLVRDQKEVRLLIVGEGDNRAEIEKMIDVLGLAKDVYLTGSINNVFPYLKAARLFILSSTQEALGNVVVEALACGTPVVSTDCGGPREILMNGRLGTLVPPQNPSAMAQAILDALSSPHDPAPLKARAQDFLTTRAAKAYLSLMSQEEDTAPAQQTLCAHRAPD